MQSTCASLPTFQVICRLFFSVRAAKRIFSLPIIQEHNRFVGTKCPQQQNSSTYTSSLRVPFVCILCSLLRLIPRLITSSKSSRERCTSRICTLYIRNEQSCVHAYGLWRWELNEKTKLHEFVKLDCDLLYLLLSVVALPLNSRPVRENAQTSKEGTATLNSSIVIDSSPI
jgi:hypothetical protein